MSPHNSTKYLQPHLDVEINETPSSDCSPRGSISLATSDDNLLPPRTPGSTASKPIKAPSHPRRPASRTVHFAEKPQRPTPSPAPVYRAPNKSQKAKRVASTTLKGAGTIAGGIFGCICYILTKACILEGDSGLSGSGSRVVVARTGEEGFVQGNRRIVEKDMRGYAGYYNDEKRRVRVPTHVRTAQHVHSGQKTHGNGDLRTGKK